MREKSEHLTISGPSLPPVAFLELFIFEWPVSIGFFPWLVKSVIVVWNNLKPFKAKFASVKGFRACLDTDPVFKLIPAFLFCCCFCLLHNRFFSVRTIGDAVHWARLEPVPGD